MGWPHLWVSSAGTSFNADFGMSRPDGETHGLSIFLRQGDHVFRTWFTAQRGSEAIGNIWGFLDAAPYGRQEAWRTLRPAGPRPSPTSGGGGMMSMGRGQGRGD